MTKPIMVIIDEAKWCRRLLGHEGGRMCALGHMAAGAGFSMGTSVDRDLARTWLRELGLGYETEAGSFSCRVAIANDNLEGDARKLELTRLFREQGMVLCFVDSSKAKVVEEPVMGCSWVTA